MALTFKAGQRGRVLFLYQPPELTHNPGEAVIALTPVTGKW